MCCEMSRLTGGSEVVSLTLRPPFTPRKTPIHFLTCVMPKKKKRICTQGTLRSWRSYDIPISKAVHSLHIISKYCVADVGDIDRALYQLQRLFGVKLKGLRRECFGPSEVAVSAFAIV
jgi:hypothetical protein